MGGVAVIKHLELWARVDNVTNAGYETAGALNFNAFADSIPVERFVAPGPPVAGFAGVRVRFYWASEVLGESSCRRMTRQYH